MKKITHVLAPAFLLPLSDSGGQTGVAPITRLSEASITEGPMRTKPYNIHNTSHKTAVESNRSKPASSLHCEKLSCILDKPNKWNMDSHEQNMHKNPVSWNFTETADKKTHSLKLSWNKFKMMTNYKN